MPFAEYRRSLRRTFSSGQATEHSYRPALQKLLKDVGGKGVDAINEPTHADYGAPDFVVEQQQVPIGHVECKDIGTNLDAEEESEQLQRYREALPNLILTDYLEFRWFANGELRAKARLGQLDSAGRLSVETGGDDSVRELFTDFFDAEVPVVGEPADLARRMASKTRLLRNTIEQLLTHDAGSASALTGLLASYREVLINNLSIRDFADLQAQTAAYGLFAARCLHDGQPAAFTRQSAVFAQTTPFLRDVFGHIAGPNTDARIAWIIDDLALLLARADMAAILEGFGRPTRQEDPVVHFYEDFLAAYDPKLRELRGVFYTPEPVVSYIVRSVDWLLRERFGLNAGLADTAEVELSAEDGQTRKLPKVLILDPAAGTGTFLREVVSHVRTSLADTGLAGAWEPYVQKHLLPRLFGFELLMAPYAICHLKLALEISGESDQFVMPEGERLGVYLTNSLAEAHETASGPMFASEIVREARDADAIKRDHPVMVVIGNPPYSGHSANKGPWINDLLRGRVAEDPESYFTVDGEPLDERNPKWLNDDYVKFIRFAQWRIGQTGEGVLGFVTNHSYLDNPTFRGMRQSLMETFDEIWLLDLHGNSKRREQTPDGGPDQNVFDIQQGVAIGIFVRHGDSLGGLAKVMHADLWGKRGDEKSGKYAWLAENDIASTPWREVSPRAPDYFFVPRDYALLDEFEAGWKLTDIAQVNSVGIVTARDKIAIQWTEDDMRRVAEAFTSLTGDAARQQYELGEDSQDWKVTSAQEDIRSHADANEHVKPILYRPFDVRATYYTGTASGFICRPRSDVMHHMLAGSNLGLAAGRAGNVVGSSSWDVAIAVNAPTDFNLFRRGGNCLFPLYLYPQGGDGMGLGADQRSPNLAPEFTEAFAVSVGMRFAPDNPGDLESTFGPEDAFHYIYAVLHSPEYRRRYADFLKSDFPRVPLPRSRDLFAGLAGLGAELVSLHLMDADGDDKPSFAVPGTGKVEGVRYSGPADDAPGRVWINRDQHFEGVSPQAWEFTIGGYQPAKKWLQDRKGRVLDFEDIQTYQRICAALAETPRIMHQIDDIIEAQGGWPLGAHRTHGSESELPQIKDASEPQRVTKALDTLADFEFEDRKSAWS